MNGDKCPECSADNHKSCSGKIFLPSIPQWLGDCLCDCLPASDHRGEKRPTAWRAGWFAKPANPGDTVIIYCVTYRRLADAAETVRRSEAERGNHLEFVRGEDEPENGRYRLEYRQLA